jgi:hypothetical protein
MCMLADHPNMFAGYSIRPASRLKAQDSGVAAAEEGMG